MRPSLWESSMPALKQQSALEFLVTYSWAFLIIALAVALVAILSGSPSQSNYLPSQCSIQPLIPCQKSILIGANGNTPIQFKVIILNNLAPYLYMPGNSFTVTATDIGSSGTNNYTGSCSPSLLLKGSEAICQASITGSLAPVIGTAVSLPFVIKYQICSTGNTAACPAASYSTTGYASQSLSKSSSSLYALQLTASTNALISVNGQRFASGSTVYLLPGTYPAYAAAPSGYIFSSWSKANSITVASTSRESTNITLTGNATLTANFASLTSTASTIPTTIPGASYVPITLTNSQSSATPSTFQQMIVVDSATYSSYINSNWDNVEFTTGPGGAGSVLQAWIESNASNTASATVVWVKLTSSISGNGGTQTIYMDFMSSSELSSSGPTGEAPTLSSTYGQYDNGGDVFPYYQSFGGLSSLPSGWGSSATTLSYNSTSIGISSIYSAGWGNVYFAIPSCCNTAPETLDMYGNQGLSTASYSTGFGFSGTTNIAGGSYPAFLRTFPPGSGSYFDLQGTGSAISTALVANVYSVTSIQVNSTNMTFYYNYKRNTAVASSTSALTYIVAGSASLNAYVHWTWIRMRPSPPNGVMPSVSLGSLT